MIRAAVLGLALSGTVVLAWWGVAETEVAPTDTLEVAAPTVTPVFPEVEALAPALTPTLALDDARRVAQRAVLQIRTLGCGDAAGRGFAVDSHTLIADRDALPGSGSLSASAANRPLTPFGAASAYSVGELAVAQIARTFPRKLTPGRGITSGASVVALAERNGKLTLLPGVVVDSGSGADYGVRAKVLRLSSAVRPGDTGPVLDARGRVVAVAFAVDPRTTLGVAIPVSALRGRAAARTLDALPACAD